jgi:cellulose synthase operon protein C
MLGLVPEVLTFGKDPGPTPPPTAEHQGLLLTHALVMAGHFDRHDLIGPLIDRFIALVRAKTGDQRYDLINAAAGQSIRSLRRFGLKDEIDKLLRRLQDELLGGQTAVAFRTKLIGKPEWAKAFQSLLGIAGGWLSYGVMVQAAPILDDARDFLLSPAADKLLPKDYTPLAQAYIAAVGQGSAEYGLPRIIELFARMNPERVTNGWTTAPCYSRFHLNIAEEVVLALTSDDFALGPSGRRWLEEDEYLIRRRIHRDMKRHLERSGL